MIVRIFEWLFHRHNWVDVDKGELVRYNEDTNSVVTYGTWIHQRCSKCNFYRKIDL